MAKPPVSEAEEWRPVPGYPHYEASSLGRIRSLDRTVFTNAGIYVRHSGKILQGRPSSTSPYLSVSLPVRAGDGVPPRFKHHRIHVIICTTFHGPKPSPKYEVAHNDGKPLNNRPINLRWATREDNFADKARHGTLLFGNRNPQTILSEEDVRAIRALHATRRVSHETIASLFNISRPNVTLIINRVNWKQLS
jgi:hypothetical protein